MWNEREEAQESILDFKDFSEDLYFILAIKCSGTPVEQTTTYSHYTQSYRYLQREQSY